MDINALPADIVSILQERSRSPERIAAMTPEEVFTEYCEWHGIIRWSDTLIRTLDKLRAAARPVQQIPLARESGKVMNMQFAVLLDAEGNKIENPASQRGSLSWNLDSGEAYAWAEDGKTCLGKLIRTRIGRIEAAGIWVEGDEEIGDGTRVRAQQWRFRPA